MEITKTDSTQELPTIPFGYRLFGSLYNLFTTKVEPLEEISLEETSTIESGIDFVVLSNGSKTGSPPSSDTESINLVATAKSVLPSDVESASETPSPHNSTTSIESVSDTESINLAAAKESTLPSDVESASETPSPRNSTTSIESVSDTEPESVDSLDIQIIHSPLEEPTAPLLHTTVELTLKNVEGKIFAKVFTVEKASDVKVTDITTDRDQIFLMLLHAGHWTVLEVNRDTEQISYYDPKGNPLSCHSDIEQIAININNDFFNSKNSFLERTPPEGPQTYPHQAASDAENCGLYCLLYITARYEGTTFTEFWGKEIPTDIITDMFDEQSLTESQFYDRLDG